MAEFWNNHSAKIIFTVSIILLTMIANKTIKALVNRYTSHKGRALWVNLLASLLPIILWIVAIIVIGSQWQTVSSVISTILTSSGVLALGISLAAQESLTNLIDGMFLSYYKPFEIGDRITLPEKNITGVVSDMNLRHTIIRTFNNSNYIVSNSALYSAIVENSSSSENYTYSMPITISYDSDIDLARKIITEVVSSHPAFIDRRTEEEKLAGKPAVGINFNEFADSGITLKVSITTRDVGTSFGACSDIRYEIKKRFDAEGVRFPFTTITIDNLHKQD